MLNGIERVLVVDDDDVDREAVVRLLSIIEPSVHLDQQSSLQGCLSSVEEESYDCILLDYRLGSETGLALLEHLRQSAACDTPVIMLSSMEDEKLMLSCLQAGAQDYLLKGDLNRAQLARSIRYAVERSAISRELRYVARHDSLTGLATRSVLLSGLSSAMLRAQRMGKSLAVMFIDLDFFKDINDTLGHQFGDQILVKVAGRLKECVRRSDCVSRLGGDEFAVLLDDINHRRDAITLADKIMAMVRKPIRIDGKEIRMTASIGLAVFPGCSTVPEDVMCCADLAMYEAKRSGRDRYRFFSESMQLMARKRADLKQELIRAIENEEFDVYYQPIIDLKNRRLKGLEALVRWQHPKQGIVPPGCFIPFAEEAGLIDKIGDWVLKRTLSDMMRWQKTPGSRIDEMTVNVNVSVLQLKHQNFIKVLSDRLGASTIRPEQLTLEITESTLIEDLDKAANTLHEIHDMGVGIAIDDFGTGYASLRHLQKLPLTVLKIDRSFVCKMLEDHKTAAIVKAMITLADAMELQVVAEGVESWDEVVVLQDCDHLCVQGYLFSKPMPASEIVHIICGGETYNPPASVTRPSLSLVGSADV